MYHTSQGFCMTPHPYTHKTMNFNTENLWEIS